MTDTMHEVYLHGSLGQKYGTEPITIFARDLVDVINGLACNVGKEIKLELLIGSWHIGVGKPKVEGEPSEEDTLLTDDTIRADIADQEIHIYPRIEGAITLAAIGSALSAIGLTAAGGGVSGIASALAGSLAIVVIDTAITLGVAIGLSAIVQAISTSSPKMDYNSAEVDRNASLLYNGVVNITEQGGPVPLLYGKHMIGSTVISAAMVSDELGLTENQLAPTDSNFALPISLSWAGVGATLTNILNGLNITKTAAIGAFGGAVLSLNLEDSTTYKVTVAAEALYDIASGDFHTYDDITIDAIDGVTELGQAYLIPASYNAETYVLVWPTFTFTTLASQVTPVLRIYPTLSSPPGTERFVTVVKIEKVNV